MVSAVWYEFDECTVQTTSGAQATIPAGVWAVAELNSVTIKVDRREVSTTQAEFSRLKLEKLARKRP